jgi:hypothetical protein
MDDNIGKICSQEATDYPATAVPTWSGFVYQGKIALYHCLKRITQGDLDFDLQLDSSDDFAIYKDGNLLSAHQVKAKISTYRSGYTEALKKCAAIEFDRIKGTERYLHVSVQLDNVSDYIGENKELVQFYTYGTKKHCGLGEIESLTKKIIRQICNSKNVSLSEGLLHYNYCLLSEKISSTAIEVHRLVQDDQVKANKSAYEKRIAASGLLSDILAKNPYSDIEYYTVQLRDSLYCHLERRLDTDLPKMNDESYARARDLFEHFRVAETDNLNTLCQLMKPSERFSSLQRADIRRYSELIETMTVDR